MKLLSTLNIRIKKGFLPHLTNEVYKRGCEIRRSMLVDNQGEYDLFNLELFYSNREKYKGFIDKISRHEENFIIDSIENDFEKEIIGGLLNISGKMEIENILDYEMKVRGISELAAEMIDNNEDNIKYTGISSNAGLISGIRSGSDSRVNLLKSYVSKERDSIIINRFTGLNALPLVITYAEIDDLIKTLRSVEGTFSVLRLCCLEGVDDTDIYDQIYSDCSLPALSQFYDEIPLYLLTVINHLIKKNKLDIKDKNVGFVGLNVSALRLARLLLKTGFYRILGCDNNIKLMHNFEKHGGLATSQENIFNNSDVVILFKDHFTEDDLKKTGSGQFVISLIDIPIDAPELKEKGVREIIDMRWMDLAPVFPGILSGLLNSEIKTLNDNNIINLSKKITDIKSEKEIMPDVFSGIHEKLKDYVQSID